MNCLVAFSFYSQPSFCSTSVYQWVWKWFDLVLVVKCSKNESQPSCVFSSTQRHFIYYIYIYQHNIYIYTHISDTSTPICLSRIMSSRVESLYKFPIQAENSFSLPHTYTHLEESMFHKASTSGLLFALSALDISFKISFWIAVLKKKEKERGERSKQKKQPLSGTDSPQVRMKNTARSALEGGGGGEGQKFEKASLYINFLVYFDPTFCWIYPRNNFLPFS